MSRIPLQLGLFELDVGWLLACQLNSVLPTKSPSKFRAKALTISSSNSFLLSKSEPFNLHKR
jgi:hypothetical protein